MASGSKATAHEYADIFKEAEVIGAIGFRIDDPF